MLSSSHQPQSTGFQSHSDLINSLNGISAIEKSPKIQKHCIDFVDAIGEGDPKEQLNAGTFCELLTKNIGEQLKFNQLTKGIEYKGKKLPSDEIENIYVLLQQRGINVSKSACNDAIDMHAQINSYDPIQKY